MRIDEIASAEEQMELWKLVNQSVWSSIEHQRQQQAKENEAKAAARRLKPKGSSKRLPNQPKISIPPKSPTTPKPQPSVAPKGVTQNKVQGQFAAPPNPQANLVAPKPPSNTIKPIKVMQSVGPPPPVTQATAPMTPQQMLLMRQNQSLHKLL